MFSQIWIVARVFTHLVYLFIFQNACEKKMQRRRISPLLLQNDVFVVCVMCHSTDMDGIGNTMQKKAAELERLAEVLITGEQLRWVGLRPDRVN